MSMWTVWRMWAEMLLFQTWQLSSVWRSSLLRAGRLSWFSTVLNNPRKYVLRSGGGGRVCFILYVYFENTPKVFLS
jgi:hypothetical protein